MAVAECGIRENLAKYCGQKSATARLEGVGGEGGQTPIFFAKPWFGVIEAVGRHRIAPRLIKRRSPDMKLLPQVGDDSVHLRGKLMSQVREEAHVAKQHRR